MERKKTRAEEREFYRDYIYPAPKVKTAGARPARAPRGKNGAGSGGKYAAVILIILALTGALLLFDYLSNGLAIGLFKKSSGNVILKAVDYYAAETGAFTSLNQAKARADETAAAGGAGYIYNDGTFHVFFSAHAKKADAEAAAAGVSGTLSADIFTLKIAGRTVAYTGGKPQKDAAHAAFLMPPTVFASMTDFAAKLKSGGLTVPQCYIKLQTLETDTRTALDKLNAAAGADAAMPLIRIKAELTSAVNILSDVADLTADIAKLQRDLNYNAIKILCSYKDMMGEI